MKSSRPSTVVLKRVGFALLGAFVFGAIFILINAVGTPNFPAAAYRQAFILLALYGISMAILNTLFFAGIERWGGDTNLSFRLILLALAAFLMSAVASTWIGGHLIRFFYPDINVLGLQQYLIVSFYSMLFGLPVFLYLAARELWKKALERVREKELAEERLEKELLAARLQALQAQTNPHFLFNALNSIAALIATDPAQAEATVERLAGLFRYATDRHDGRSVRLAEEVAVVDDYLAIEKVRFGDRLQCRITVDPELLDCRVPPLLLQPMVENAVKHGVAVRECETVLEVTADVSSENTVRMKVRNQGPAPAPETAWRGVGLQNLQSRCRTLFGDRFRFSLIQASPGWTVAELEIPREEPAETNPETLPAVEKA